MSFEASGRKRLLLICEGVSDQPVAMLLTRQVLCRAVEWLEEYWANAVEWIDSPDGLPEQFWRQTHLAKSRLQRPTYQRMQKSRRAIGDDSEDYLSACFAFEKIVNSNLADAVVVLRDGDDVRSERLAGWRAAIQEYACDLPVALGVCGQCIEAWQIAAMAPNEEALTRHRQELGFSPHERPHELSHKEAHPKSAKRVLAELAGEDAAQRAERCLGEAECLQRLCVNGREAGAADFLNELHALRTAFGETGPSDPPCVAAV